jgi:hypothetical protein
VKGARAPELISYITAIDEQFECGGGWQFICQT